MESPSTSELRLAVLGCGSVGSAFAFELAAAGGELVLWSRTAARAAALGERVAARSERGPEVIVDLRQALDGVDGALLTVTDGAVEEMAGRCAAARAHEGAAGAAPILLHTCGYFGPEKLAPAAAAGWATGKLHPLAAMPTGDDARGALRGAWFVVGGDPRARELASTIVGSLDGHELPLVDGPEVSRTYHGAATLLAGGVVALMDYAVRVFETCLLEKEGAHPALATLLTTAVRHLEELDTSEALAGPVARGAADIVRGHLEAFAARDEATARLYTLLVARMTELAARRGSIDDAQRAALERLLTDE